MGRGREGWHGLGEGGIDEDEEGGREGIGCVGRSSEWLCSCVSRVYASLCVCAY